MKNGNTFVNTSFAIDFFSPQMKDLSFCISSICIILTMLICQTTYSKNYLAKNNIEFKDKQLGCYNQVNDTVKKLNMDLNELNKLAEFPGGLEKFYTIVLANFDNSDIDYEGFGKLNVSFSIEKDGSLSSIKVNDDKMSKSMKKSIVRVLKSIKTKWSPAIINNQPVRSSYDLPLVFN